MTDPHRSIRAPRTSLRSFAHPAAALTRGRRLAACGIAAVFFLLPLPARAQSAPGAAASTPPDQAQPQPPQPEAAKPGSEQGNPPVVTAGPGGFSIRSADGAYRLGIGAYAQMDYRADLSDIRYLEVDEFLLRRARVIVTGTVYKFIDFRLTPDFGEGKAAIQDAYIDVRFVKGLTLRAGKFKPFYGLERQTSPSDLRFVERSLASALTPGRDIGFAFWGDTAKKRVTYSIGVFNGVADSVTGDGDDNDGKDVVGRLLLHPFATRPRSALEGLALGIATTRGPRDGHVLATGLPSYKSMSQLVFFRYRPLAVVADGTIWRIAPQAAWEYGCFGIYGEHMTTTQDVLQTDTRERATLKTRAWTVAASVMLTGEHHTFSKVAPDKPFARGSGWGALEVAVRMERFAADDAAFPVFAPPDLSSSRARAWGVSAIWYLSREFKLMSTYERTSFTGGTPAGGDRTDESVLFTRMQVYF